MFGLADLISLIISAFIILPIVVFLRESGYLIASVIFGVNNPRLTIGSGPRIVKIGMFDIRKYYHLYSWYSYDSLKRKSKFVYVSIYAGPILVNLIVALTINAMLANDLLQEYETFWSRFVFYAFYYVLFDIVPMKTANGMPNNGLIIYEMLRYGRRTDYNQEPFIPSTSEVEEQYQEEMEKIEEVKEQQKDQIEHEKQEEKQELKEQKAHEKEKAAEHQKERKQQNT
ncbi:hypothetical protein AC739_06800 [Planococcus glaciei]|uniref:Uncharacterized protein n=1 Tax=Planococcus glaciei TaxID=459472 RepID=A0A7H8Q9J0_9BACL|nr:hypothetical protein [Planococcus glaciei]ETP67460.1 hypothetical protein G159_17560 [Planococcus glaciei CHR43]KOF11092.1 hypothetical protein AC739_06800 [Planococcus glaciei]MBX0315651.1 hypothetical protein [Planococcus glaciei]QDY45527.1 hypothetical protein FK545_09010 [Planococcus glaciei]QKX50638.1 hypothetical protein HF394_08625 [Planococcus glaciei]